MPLLNGAWKLTVNGIDGILNINNIAADGRISGNISVFGMAMPIQFNGSWDEAAQAICFETMGAFVVQAGLPPPGSNDFRSQFFGWLYNTRDAGAPGADVRWVFCGYVSSSLMSPFPGLQINTRRTIFGWTAEIKQVI